MFFKSFCTPRRKAALLVWLTTVGGVTLVRLLSVHFIRGTRSSARSALTGSRPRRAGLGAAFPRSRFSWEIGDSPPPPSWKPLETEARFRGYAIYDLIWYYRVYGMIRGIWYGVMYMVWYDNMGHGGKAMTYDQPCNAFCSLRCARAGGGDDALVRACNRHCDTIVPIKGSYYSRGPDIVPVRLALFVPQALNCLPYGIKLRSIATTSGNL